MTKNFIKDLVSNICHQNVIIEGYKRVANYISSNKPCEISKMPVLPENIFKPYSVITKTVTYYSKPKRRDPSRRWK